MRVATLALAAAIGCGGASVDGSQGREGLEIAGGVGGGVSGLATQDAPSPNLRH